MSIRSLSSIILSLIILSGYSTLVIFLQSDRGVYAQSITSEQGESIPQLKLRVYSVPPSFRSGYVTILSQFITYNDDLKYPKEITAEELVSNATESVEETDLAQDQDGSLKETVQYDAEKHLLVVLATDAEHKQIQTFIDHLTDKNIHKTAVLYRLAYVERDIHPKLIDYPYEFFIEGKSWDDGRTGSQYPKWLVEHRKRFPDILFKDVDVDRDDKHTRFEVEGFARTKKQAEHITKFVQRADDTDSDTNIKEHDFMAESQENLNRVLGDIFPRSNVKRIIHSLQKTEVYQVEAEAVLASESSVPGFFRTVLGDGFSVEIVSEEGIETDGKYRIDIQVFKKRDDDDHPFDEKCLHLSTSLITSFGQINMLGIRHHDDRYVLLFSMEDI